MCRCVRSHCWNSLILLALYSVPFLSTVISLHVQGQWNSSHEYFKVLARFGVEKSNPNDLESTRAFVYGNVSVASPLSTLDENILLLVNKSLFSQFYLHFSHHLNGSNVSEITELCSSVRKLVLGKHIKRIANQSSLSPYIVQNVPCPPNEICFKSSDTEFIENSQYSFTIDSLNESTFWYLLLLPCHQDLFSPEYRESSTNETTPKWKPTLNGNILHYDFWLLNGHPERAPPFLLDLDRQFSIEKQKLLLYFVWTFLFLLLLILQLCALSIKTLDTSLKSLFTVCLGMHSLAYIFHGIHKVIFAFNGQGLEPLVTTSQIIKILAGSLFMLFALIVAKGWSFNRRNIYSKTMLFFVWCIHVIITLILFILMKRTNDIFHENGQFYSLSSLTTMLFRLFFMFWFLRELRHTMILEQNSQKLRFCLHFGAGMLVWFVQLPLVTLVALQIQPMSRFKIISGFSTAADIFAYGLTTFLMWRTANLNKTVHENGETYGFCEDKGSFRNDSLRIPIPDNRVPEGDDFQSNSCDTSRLQ